MTMPCRRGLRNLDCRLTIPPTTPESPNVLPRVAYPNRPRACLRTAADAGAPARLCRLSLTDDTCPWNAVPHPTQKSPRASPPTLTRTQHCRRTRRGWRASRYLRRIKTQATVVPLVVGSRAACGMRLGAGDLFKTVM